MFLKLGRMLRVLPSNRFCLLWVSLLVLSSATLIAQLSEGVTTLPEEKNHRFEAVLDQILAETNEVKKIENALTDEEAKQGQKTSTEDVAHANPKSSSKKDEAQFVQSKLELAEHLRIQKSFQAAESLLIGMIRSQIDEDSKKRCFLGLAAVLKDAGKFARTQQVYAEFLRRYPDDPHLPEVYLRQGLLYREMGLATMAISKFYAVISTSLNLKLDKLEYYQTLVCRAQLEIAETYFMQHRFAESADFYGRLLKLDNPFLKQHEILFKLVQANSALEQWESAAGRATEFLSLFGDEKDAPEARYLLAEALKKMGRTADAMREVMVLLQGQQQSAKANPETWAYWQQRTGKDIANQLFKEGDYLNALEIYKSLAAISPTLESQLPIRYQMALIYESLRQPGKAVETLKSIVEANSTNSLFPPALKSLVELAEWRINYLDWEQNAILKSKNFEPALQAKESIEETP